jgi:CheY-like chemotaxis protein
MGGRLELRGRAGGGSATTLVLPAAPAPPAPAPPTRTRRAQVLAVAGDPADLRLVERLLGAHAHADVRGATRGGDALALAREAVPDLVLVDLELPDLHGVEVLRGLRADPATAHVPVVVLAADATPGAARLLRDAGATEHLTKPLDVRALLETVSRLLAARGA